MWSTPDQRLLRLLNRLGNALPKRVQRAISDFPGVLTLLERASADRYAELLSPEQDRIVVNPLFHTILTKAGGIDHYEPLLRTAILRLTTPAMVAYDIGANVGVFTVLLARLVGPAGVVYAFEPEPINFACLKRSVQVNNLSNVCVDARAIGVASGTETFDRRGGAFSGRLIGGNATYHRSSNLIDVPTVSFDDLIAKEGARPPNIVKLDVEGNEVLALRGMTKTLRTHKPTILCEVHTHLGETDDAVRDMLRENGYTLYALSEAARPIGEAWLPMTATNSERHLVAIHQSQGV